MTQYIDKAAVVAEINKFIERAEAERVLYPKTILAGKNYLLIEDYKKLLSKIDTLEVKEVDLEHLEQEVKDFCYEYDNRKEKWYNMTPHDKNIMVNPTWANFAMSIAKHFFELGIAVGNKAQKGEIWQVVDNVNHPQADKNKIYCVFTKNRYILATVINHPKDEELLQWKCTEFPYHRYDMCEGDKYMKIV